MSRLEERKARRLEQARDKEKAGFWPELCRRIDAGQVIPIISNSVFNDLIFDIDGDQIVGISPDLDNPQGWSIEEQLANAWAKEVRFPLSEQHWLPRVALFDRVVNSEDDPHAKTRYLNWLKKSVLLLAEEDPDVDPENIGEIRDDFEKYSFSDVAVKLGYPKTVKGYEDPLRHLARLKLPIYVTTSYFDFLERAIEDDHTKPRTQICFWSEEPITYVKADHKTDNKFTPTANAPLVYHLFGLETYPESMVLNEDDYLDFLAAVSKDVNQKKPILPKYLRKALTQSSLILLGYRLRDWDFRVMFRGLINTTPYSLRKFSLAIQLDPQRQTHIVSPEKIKEYLDKYFGSSNFTVEWGTPHGFVETLWDKWDQWRR